jgi:iron-sulfur cluster assembly accessory protein
MNTETATATEAAVRLTENAAAEVKSLLEKPENAGKHLRVYVEQGGCSGMQYSMIFDERRPDDAVGELHGVLVLVDPFSAQYLRGAVVDFSDSLTAGGFKISNPNAAQSCGCGKSFTAQAS